MNLFRNMLRLGIIAVLLVALDPVVVVAQSVRGHGEVTGFSIGAQISVNAWLTGDGNPVGQIVWTGPIAPADGYGSAQRLLIDVINLSFDGNTANVLGVISHAAFPDDIGRHVLFIFTDNSGTEKADVVTVVGWGDVYQSSIKGNISVNE